MVDESTDDGEFLHFLGFKMRKVITTHDLERSGFDRHFGKSR